MDGTGTKPELRRRILAARAAMSEAERDRAASAIRDAVLGLPGITMGGTVAAYYSVGSEPGTRKLVAALWRHGVYVLLPIFLPDGGLDWAVYEGPDSLSPAAYGLLEPTGPRYGADALRRVSTVICPALAVDRRGVRLGRGAGCYDRALSLVGPNTTTLAVTYDTELLGELPAEEHDRAVKGVVTPGSGVIRLPADGGDARG
ncbi:5-formyltetrahydrofolate cyclo-ligase [Marinactinospora thermotolerans]|uniref:5-formyltetrahydrofolate cyclo-ligase n=1 Tax=Marinactinospora thermotolerans DSM 45154 TaxID=1122192 RepID=A0A1T4SZJ9_9ACTN|nr:5-formyltetrahydrofolate cyclo-ligase [Marinactinospora thermotolerans]SKA33636.1 5-formyltetrahydrofolate cyclo-ligase [Marinactinospora thermotolerans DSM 45154]